VVTCGNYDRSRRAFRLTAVSKSDIGVTRRRCG
jgi:hypothetical protein